MGIVYLITNTKNGTKYVGETSRTLEERYQEHKDMAIHYQRYLKNPERYKWKGSCTYLYKAIHAHGIEHFVVEVLATEDDATKRWELEKHYIKELNTLAPNGYNLTTGGGTCFEHCEATKKIISTKVRAAMLADIDKFRQSDFTKGMPAYCSYKDTGTYKAYLVNNHPLCKRKYFSVSKYGSIEKAKEECIKFLEDLNAGGVKHVTLGPNGVPVKGLRKPLKEKHSKRALPIKIIAMRKISRMRSCTSNL
jgi:group I intron endonuclease